MEKHSNLTLSHYWKASSSDERQEIIDNTFKYIDHLESQLKNNGDIANVSEILRSKMYVSL